MMQDFGWVIEIKRPGVNLNMFPGLRAMDREIIRSRVSA